MILFTPAKITGDKWAEKLLDGEVFMRPLREFGIWGRFENFNDPTINNSYRGDLLEGASTVFSSVDDLDLLRGVNPVFKSLIKNPYFVDYGDIQYLKIFSLYCLEYDPIQDILLKPDEQIKEFGNSVVIINDFCEFLRRLMLKVMSKWGKGLFFVNRVSFFDFKTTKNIDPLFSKNEVYKYQKELRIAIGKLKNDPHAEKGKDNLHLARSLDCEHIQIGSIRDIATKISIDNFLKLREVDNLYKGSWCQWPPNIDPAEMTIFDFAVYDTQIQMSNYQTNKYKLMFSM